MKKLIFKILVVIIPIGLMVIIINFIMDPGNIFSENYEMKIVELQLKNLNVILPDANYSPWIVSKMYIDKTDELPNTISIGSSRIKALDKNLSGAESFHNFFVWSAGINDYYSILGLYLEKNQLPETIIIGIDPWIFNRNYNNTTINLQNEMMAAKEIINGNVTSSPNLNTGLENYFQVFSLSYFQESTKQFFKNGIVKRNPEATEDNYREGENILYPDGSHVDPLKTISLSEYESIEAAKKECTGEFYNFGGYYEINESLVSQFEDLISYFLTNNVKVIFYLPPLHPVLYKYLVTDDNCVTVDDCEKYLISYGKEYNIPIYGAYNPELVNCTSYDFFDGIHLKSTSFHKAWIQEY